MNVKVNGKLTVTGAIRADGLIGEQGGNNAGGGAGGSIYLRADVWDGLGTLSAFGGGARSAGGGGGRIAVEYRIRSFGGTYTAHGGNAGLGGAGNASPGTIFFKDTSTSASEFSSTTAEPRRERLSQRATSRASNSRSITPRLSISPASRRSPRSLSPTVRSTCKVRSR